MNDKVTPKEWSKVQRDFEKTLRSLLPKKKKGLFDFFRKPYFGEERRTPSLLDRETLPHFKESMFGSFDQVRLINDCDHEFEPRRGLLFGYMLVQERCRHCGTYRQ